MSGNNQITRSEHWVLDLVPQHGFERARPAEARRGQQRSGIVRGVPPHNASTISAQVTGCGKTRFGRL